MVTPRKIASGGESALPTNAPCEPRKVTRPSHNARAAKTTVLKLECPLLSSVSTFSGMLPIVSFFVFIYLSFSSLFDSYINSFAKYFQNASKNTCRLQVSIVLGFSYAAQSSKSSKSNGQEGPCACAAAFTLSGRLLAGYLWRSLDVADYSRPFSWPL